MKNSQKVVGDLKEQTIIEQHFNSDNFLEGIQI
jgi:hypothetical protein